MSRRAGATLVEVLVAIFVMAIGLLSLLALFPLGALSMAQSIKDDRTAHASANANAIALSRDLRHDNLVFQGMTNTAPPNTSGPSYPAYVDPFRRQSGSLSLNAQPPTNANNPNITRCSVSFVQTNPAFQIPRLFTLLDDITFDTNGQPDTSGGSIDRAGRYSWAYLCRQVQYNPNSGTQSTTPVEMTIVVYDRRSLALTTTRQPTDETPYQAFFDSTSAIATLAWNPAAQETPAVVKGSWIFDATMAPDVHGYFYRVVAVTEPGAGGPGTMDVTLQTNPRASAPNGVAIVMENVAEVFEMGPR